MEQKWEKFLKTGKIEDYLEYSKLKKELKEGNWYLIKGYTKNDPYSKEIVLNARDIVKIEKDEETGRYLLKKSVTDKKDQTYALYNLTQEQLEHTLLPIGEFEKERVREIANNRLNQIINEWT